MIENSAGVADAQVVLAEVNAVGAAHGGDVGAVVDDEANFFAGARAEDFDEISAGGVKLAGGAGFIAELEELDTGVGEGIGDLKGSSARHFRVQYRIEP